VKHREAVTKVCVTSDGKFSGENAKRIPNDWKIPPKETPSHKCFSGYNVDQATIPM